MSTDIESCRSVEIHHVATAYYRNSVSQYKMHLIVCGYDPLKFHLSNRRACKRLASHCSNATCFDLLWTTNPHQNCNNPQQIHKKSNKWGLSLMASECVWDHLSSALYDNSLPLNSLKRKLKTHFSQFGADVAFYCDFGAAIYECLFYLLLFYLLLLIYYEY